MAQTREWRTELIWWLAISAATTIAFSIGVSPTVALIVGASMFGLTAILHFGRGSDTIRAISGAGDERDRSLYTHAMAGAGTVTGLAITAWWLVTVATGAPNQTLFVLVILFSGSFFTAAAVHARRG